MGGNSGGGGRGGRSGGGGGNGGRSGSGGGGGSSSMSDEEREMMEMYGTPRKKSDVDVFIEKQMAERKAQNEKGKKSSFFNSNYIRSESPEAQRARAYDEGHGGRGPATKESNFARRMRLMREGKI